MNLKEAMAALSAKLRSINDDDYDAWLDKHRQERFARAMRDADKEKEMNCAICDKEFEPGDTLMIREVDGLKSPVHVQCKEVKDE